MVKRSNISLGIVLIIVGLLMLLGQWINFANWGWPLFIIVPGLIQLVLAFTNKDSAGLAIPGSIVTTVGLILFVQNITGNYQSWAYAWGLIVAAVGFGRFMRGVLTNNTGEKASGWRNLLLGLGFFVGFGAFFELFIFSESRLARYLVPVGLVLVGAYLVFQRKPAALQYQENRDGTLD
jgi:hypothetical protein